MQLSTKLARIVFLGTTLVLLILSYTLYVQIKDLIRSYNQINEATVVKLKLEQTLSALKDAETAQRGFLLTNDSLFLEPYQGAYERSRQLVTDLKTLTGSNAKQQNSLNVLNTLIEIRFRTFKNVIDQYNLPGINAETKKNHLLKGKNSMDSIRYYIADITGIEEIQMQKLQKIKERHTILTPFYALLFIATLLAILAFFYDKTIKQLNRSKKLLYKLKQLNGKLKQKNHSLELYNKELDSFTYIASHDLKEPLRKILVYTEMIENTDYQKLSERNRNHFDRIKVAAKRMQDLLDDLLLYSHTTQSSLAFENVDLNAIVKVVEENLSEEIVEHKAKIDTGTLPIIKGMPFQLKQLFENLMTNSLKYKQENQPPLIHIESSLINKKEIKHRFYKKSDQYHKIIFEDNGAGFEQSYAEKIFQLFQRVHHNTKQAGTGIGLTICKKIVQNHDGFIRATSQINGGTIFEIYLPTE